MNKLSPSAHSTNSAAPTGKSKSRITLAALSTLALAAPTPALAQVTHDWQGTTGGSFETPANWSTTTAGSLFSTLDTLTLAKDFSTATWTLDAPVSLNTLTYNDTGATSDVSGILNAGTGGTLTLGGTDPTLTTTSPLTINADLAGSAGLIKNGIQNLTLSGNNTGLTGPLTVADVAATNTNGITVTSLASLGGTTSVNVNGTNTSGGFFRLAGTDPGGITVPSSVTFNLSGQGGNSTPTGTLISAGTGVNNIEGTINVLANNVRISNFGATRLDVTGPIIASSTNGVVFRHANNEGVHLTNTANDWTGLTVHSSGVLWFEPGTLPNANIHLAASDAGSIQTSGTFTRALGTGTGQINSIYVQNGAREAGFSARGGDLTVDLGGAGADVTFYNFQSVNGTRTVGSPTITAINTTGYAVGMTVSGTGIPANTTITAIGANTLTLSAAPTASGTTAIAGSTSDNARWQTNSLNLNWDQADSKLTFVNNLDLNGYTRDIAVRANEAEITGVIKNGLAGTNAGIRKTGLNGTLTLSNINTFTGNVDVSAGNLRITNSAALGAGAKTINITNGSAGNPSLLLDGSAGAIDLPANMAFNTSNTLLPTSASIINEAGNNTIRGTVTMTAGGGGTRIASQAGKLTLTGNLTSNTAGRTLDFIGAGDIEVTGNISNGSTLALPVTKRDAGTLTLSGTANTYTGPTVLEAGVTLVNGILANTPTTIKSGATLGGSGTIGGDITLESGGTLSPGATVGPLTVGSLLTTGSGTVSYQINGLTPGTQYDQLAINSSGGGTGTVNLGTTILNLTAGFTPALNDKFFLLLNDGSDTILGNFYNGATALNEGDTFTSGGQDWLISYQDNGDAGATGNDISLTAIPEPAAPLLSLSALAHLLSRRRRRTAK